MSAVTRMPLMILVVWLWVAMVQSECIPNPMDDVNKEAEKQYITTDEYLEDIKKSTPNKYQNLLRVYGIYRACVESGTQRWTDNTGSGSCPYCRTKIEEEDKKIKTRPKLPDAWNSSSCAAVKFCHESQQGCFYFGEQGSEEECKTLGWKHGRDHYDCVGDGNTDLGDWTCQSCRDDERVRTRYCTIMCGYCRSQCPFFCKNWGFMEQNSCKCYCYSPYTGRECEKLDCSKRVSDFGGCDKFTKEQCGKEIKSIRCPNLCGLCQKSYQDEEDDGSGAIEK